MGLDPDLYTLNPSLPTQADNLYRRVFCESLDSSRRRRVSVEPSLTVSRALKVLYEDRDAWVAWHASCPRHRIRGLRTEIDAFIRGLQLRDNDAYEWVLGNWPIRLMKTILGSIDHDGNWFVPFYTLIPTPEPPVLDPEGVYASFSSEALYARVRTGRSRYHIHGTSLLWDTQRQIFIPQIQERVVDGEAGIVAPCDVLARPTLFDVVTGMLKHARQWKELAGWISHCAN